MIDRKQQNLNFGSNFGGARVVEFWKNMDGLILVISNFIPDYVKFGSFH